MEHREDKPVTESDLKLISVSHCDNLPTPMVESTDQTRQEDEEQLCEEPRQPMQDAEEVPQKQLTRPRKQGTHQNKMLTPKKIFIGMEKK